MMTLYSLMHSRRRKQIETCVDYWKETESRISPEKILKRYATPR